MLTMDAFGGAEGDDGGCFVCGAEGDDDGKTAAADTAVVRIAFEVLAIANCAKFLGQSVAEYTAVVRIAFATVVIAGFSKFLVVAIAAIAGFSKFLVAAIVGCAKFLLVVVLVPTFPNDVSGT